MSDGDGLGRDSSTRYERIDRIATGGMGEVWRARDTVLGREVAVKMLKQEYADDPTFRARFEAEARHAAGLHHPGIAAIFDYGAREGETPYLVMELVDGRPLSELIAGGRAIDPEQARLLVLQVAEALAVAHHAGVVHRDVKPANLLVTPDGRVKITDFGIARAVDSVPYTQTGQIVGTPHYFAPEQARGEAATAASDVYALGVVLFECLNGTRPFVAETPIATALAHIREPVPPLPDDVPPALAAVVRRALAKDPAARYADGAAMAVALREAGASPSGVPVPPADATQVLPAAVPAAAAAAAATGTQETTPVADAPETTAPTPLPSTPPSTPPSPPPTAPPTRSRRRWPLYAAGVIALLVLVALLAVHPWTDSSSGSGSTTGQDTVRVRAADYIGKPVGQVKAALAAKGLKTRTHQVDNSGDHEAGTVGDLDPTGQVKPGTKITLDVWGAPAGATPDQTNPTTPTKSAKPEKTKPPKPEHTTTATPSAPTPSQSPGNGNGNGTGNGTGTGGNGGGPGNGGATSGASSSPGTGGRDTTPGTPGSDPSAGAGAGTGSGTGTGTGTTGG